MARQLFDSYGRGILSRRHPRATHAGFCREALNLAFIGGTPVSRPGLKPYNAAPFSGRVVGQGWHVKSDGTRELIVAAGAAFQRAVPYGDPVNLALSLPSTEPARTTPSRAFFLSLSGGNNLTFIYDGTNTNLKYDGNQLTKMGLPEGPTPAAPSVIAGSVDAGVHDFVMTLDSGFHEGNPSSTQRTVTVSGSTSGLRFASPVNGVDYDDPQVLQWRLWATIAGGKDYFFVGSADIGVAIDYTLSRDDLSARTTLEEFVNAAPIGPFIALCEHRGQLVGVNTADVNLLRFSHIDPQYSVPEGWPSDTVLPIAHGDGDEIAALASFHEWLVVFKRNGAWAVTGNTTDGFEVTPVLAAGGGHRIGIGVQNQGAILQIENEIFFASRDGIYALERVPTGMSGGVQAKRLSGPIDELYAAANFEFSGSVIFDRKRRLFGLMGHG